MIVLRTILLSHERYNNNKTNEISVFFQEKLQIMAFTDDLIDLLHIFSGFSLRTRLHQAPESILQQLCHDAIDTALIENNGVPPEQGCNPFSSDFIVFNETVSLVPSQSCRSIHADAWCKRALMAAPMHYLPAVSIDASDESV